LYDDVKIRDGKFLVQKDGKWGIFQAIYAAMPTTSTVLINGVKSDFEAYCIDEYNYFKLRDLAYVLNDTEAQFEVEWDGVKNAIRLTSGEPYTVMGGEMAISGAEGYQEATITTSTIYIGGKSREFTAYCINEYNYFKLRDIARAFDFNVTWDGVNNTVSIVTTENYIDD